jgi:hypothetical protein
MSMRKRLLLALFLLMGLSVLGLFCVAWWTAPPKHNINPETIGRIQPGMTEADVEALMGVPAGGFSQDRAVQDSNFMMLPPPGMTPKDWLGEKTGVTVCFGQDGRVRFARSMVMFPVHVPFLDRLRRWVGL